MLRDVPLAEDLTQEALLAALEHWPATGIPDNPGAWLMATAKHRAIDHLRRGQGSVLPVGLQLVARVVPRRIVEHEVLEHLRAEGISQAGRLLCGDELRIDAGNPQRPPRRLA
jgi:DNA-directed RNA polymerase specialized sigma24 family protein